MAFRLTKDFSKILESCHAEVRGISDLAFMGHHLKMLRLETPPPSERQQLFDLRCNHVTALLTIKTDSAFPSVANSGKEYCSEKSNSGF
jgi:hypothetical protein